MRLNDEELQMIGDKVQLLQKYQRGALSENVKKGCSFLLSVYFIEMARRSMEVAE